jgi:hypothetical protein
VLRHALVLATWDQAPYDAQASGTPHVLREKESARDIYVYINTTHTHTHTHTHTQAQTALQIMWCAGRVCHQTTCEAA